MTQPLEQYETHFDLDYDNSSQFLENMKLKESKKFYLAVGAAVAIAVVSLIYVFSTIGLVKDGMYYRNEILSTEMTAFWKQQAMDEMNKNTTQLIEEGEHKITREQLGRMGWTLLHMMTGGFPDTITPELRQKWNTFLILFGQFYPCKLCSHHFLKMQKSLQPFSGNTKESLMIFMCQMHNKVNKRLNKPQHDCSKVKEEWNTCGCGEE